MSGPGATAAAWRALREELDRWTLDRWTAASRPATLWWRDDDAVAWSPALARLLALAAERAVPLTLALVPAAVDPDLARRLAAASASLAVAQHGYAHANHAPAGAKKVELHDARPSEELAAELIEGRARLEALFGPCFRPLLVPPWNRIGRAATAALPGLGFTGLSTYGARSAAEAVPGLVQVNCHVDILRWRPERGFLGTAAALGLLTGHLAARRGGGVDRDEASGLLTHHLVHDEAAWEFLSDLLRLLVEHPAVRFLDAAGLLDSARRRAKGAGP